MRSPEWYEGFIFGGDDDKLVRPFDPGWWARVRRGENSFWTLFFCDDTMMAAWSRHPKGIQIYVAIKR